MSDQNDYEYVDEDGNPVDPADLEGYEVVEEEVVDVPAPAAPVADAPAAQEPAAEAPAAPAKPGKNLKALALGAVAVVAVIGGGAAFGLSQLGNQNTAGDVKDAVASKSAEVRQSVAPSSSAAPSADAEPVVNGEVVYGLACRDGDFLAAAWQPGEPAPEHQLAVRESIAMPVGFTERMRKGAEKAGQRPKTAAVQMSDERLGVYVAGTENAQSDGSPVWWRVNIAISGGFSVIGEGYGDGSDRDAKMASCPTLDAGSYRVVGEGGSADQPTDVTLIKPAWSNGAIGGWVLIGDKLARVQVEKTPAQTSTGGDGETGQEGASSSAVPSK